MYVYIYVYIYMTEKGKGENETLVYFNNYTLERLQIVRDGKLASVW